MSVIEYRKRQAKIKGRDTLHRETEKTIRSLIITLAMIIVVLGIVTIGLSSRTSQKGYALAQEKLRNDELRNANMDLTTRLTGSATYSELGSTQSIKGMAEPEIKTYLTREDNELR